MPVTMKECRNCGKEFKASPNDYTVNCPDCRQKRYVKVTRSSEPSMSGRTFKCPDCGEVFDRGGAIRHRRETGHTFLPKNDA